ncbi:hypothetical protein SLEP1_g10597 [Rubroshorea leprosula]|uniref:Pentatricopeptide repeat-containing protein n=1 Tax=Rubroshorea leprosula TaxID=152421 RepID=A0AAV5III4_9ROSI|nr:hypothetical protein SLEP1_g10597 [Rubroshorea leprosula]
MTSNQTTAERKTFSHIFQECAGVLALNPGKQAHCRVIVSGFVPTTFVSNCLVQVYAKCGDMGYACKVFDKMPQRDVVSWNTMIFGYAACGKMGIAREYFDAMPERDVISWNSLLSGCLQNGECLKSIEVFVEMGRLGAVFDQRTFAVVLKACVGLEDYDVGIQVHGYVIRVGFETNVVTGSALVDMYAKCKKLYDSLRLFHGMPEKNWISWSAVIAGCVQNDQFIKGLELFKEMLKEGIGVSQSIYASIFRSCAGLSAFRLGSQLHGHALKTDFGSDAIVGTATLDMYSKCGSMHDAQKVFNLLPIHNLQSFNAIIIGYTQNDQGFQALHLFRLLQKSALGFDEISLSGAFSACAMIKGYNEGLQVHSLAVKSTLESNICVSNAMVDMYGKCGALAEACQVFYKMERRDAVSWNAIIAAYEQSGHEEETLSHFVSMLRSGMEPDDFTYGSVLKACAGWQALNHGMEIHNRIIKSGMGLDWFVGTALIDMHCKCGMVEEAQKIHERIQQETVVSWNAMISGFLLRKRSEDAQRYFSWMLEVGVNPDNFTYATVLDTCANLATVGLGKQIHAHIIKLELQSDVYVSSTLVDMYSKCGNMLDARLMFDKAPKRDFVTWNAMICGYANHGLGEEALEIFEDMILENVLPNHATFVSVLRACAHIGLVEKGFHYFNKMSNDYGLDPQLEHYSCMVDIMGRAGQVTEALKLISEMPFQADAVIWRTLLSICKIQGNVEVAEKAASSLLQLEPQDSSAYILLSNIYAEAGMWNKVSDVRKIMRYNKLKKEPGCSWIEIKDEVHTFLVGDKAHPRCDEMYNTLCILVDEMKWAGYVPGSEFLLEEEADENNHLEEQSINVSGL